MFAMSRARLLVALIVWLALAAVLALYAFSSTASANHSWSNYHWGRGAGQFTLGLENNLTAGSPWLQYLQTTSSSDKNDWSDSTVLDAKIVDNEAWTSTCPATSGRVKACNKEYGDNGWLGLATVWTSSGHILQGTAKMNDTYFNQPRYNTTGWRNLVMCQEVGHTFGLAHTDETNGNANLGSCMDYTGDPDGTRTKSDGTDPWGTKDNQYPGGDNPKTSKVVEIDHDYAHLKKIYGGHADGATTVGSASAASRMPPEARAVNTANRAERGRLVHRSAGGEVEVYVRDFGGGHQVITRVIRAVEEGTPTLEETDGGGGGGTHDHDDHDH
jgi:hypothetical protein